MASSELKRWSPAVNPSADNAYMVGDKTGNWVWAQTAVEQLTALHESHARLVTMLEKSRPYIDAYMEIASSASDALEIDSDFTEAEADLVTLDEALRLARELEG